MSKGTSTSVDVPPALSEYYSKTAGKLGGLQDYFWDGINDNGVLTGGKPGKGPGDTDPIGGPNKIQNYGASGATPVSAPAAPASGSLLPSGLGGGRVSGALGLGVGSNDPTGTTNRGVGSGGRGVTTIPISPTTPPVTPPTTDPNGDPDADANQFNIMSILGQNPEQEPGMSGMQTTASQLIPQMLDTPDEENQAIQALRDAYAGAQAPVTVDQDDPAIKAAKDVFDKTTTQSVMNADTLAGLGRSGAVGDSLANAWGAQLTPLIENALANKQTTANRALSAAEQLASGLSSEGATKRGAISSAYNAYNTSGGIQQAAAQKQADANEQERLRLLALAEESLTSPMSQLTSSIGSTTGKNKP